MLPERELASPKAMTEGCATIFGVLLTFLPAHLGKVPSAAMTERGRMASQLNIVPVSSNFPVP